MAGVARPHRRRCPGCGRVESFRYELTRGPGSAGELGQGGRCLRCEIRDELGRARADQAGRVEPVEDVEPVEGEPVTLRDLAARLMGWGPPGR